VDNGPSQKSERIVSVAALCEAVNGWNGERLTIELADMWQQYWRTLVPTQLFIVAACVTLFFSLGRKWTMVVVLFGVMQLGSLASIAIAARQKKQAARAREELPLGRRR
jgi:hypothetical protein